VSQLTDPTKIRGLQGVDLTLRTRVRDANRDLVTPQEVTAIYRQVFDSSGQVLENTAVEVAASFFDVLQIDDAWCVDSIGYNFKTILPGNLLQDASQTYEVYYWCVPVGGGSDFPIWFQVDLTPVRKVAFPV